MTRRRILALPVAAALLAGVFVTLAGPSAQSQTSTCPVSFTDQAIANQEQQLLVLINQYRAANGRSALVMHPTVTKAAAWFSRDMATKNYFPGSHVDSNGRSIAERLTWCGVSYSSYAENIYAGRSDAQSVFDDWRNSPVHNTNMLLTGVTAAGIGRAYNAASTYDWYWTLDITDSSASSVTTTTRPTTTTTRPSTTTTTRPSTTTTTRPVFVCPPQWAYFCSRF